jgi:hypothetical protein
MGYKAQPITAKACGSPLKADANLILGAGDIGQSKRKADYSKIVTEAVGGSSSVNSRRSNYTPFDKTGNEEEKNESGQSGSAIGPNK